MKKLLTGLMAVVMMAGLAGCGSRMMEQEREAIRRRRS